MRIIVTGGRDYSNYTMISHILEMLSVSCVVHGDCTGVDTLCKEYAIENGLTHVPYKPDWKTHGKAGGPIRNRKMLSENQGCLVVAFPGGRGTEDCIRQARSLGMVVMRVEE